MNNKKYYTIVLNAKNGVDNYQLEQFYTNKAKAIKHANWEYKHLLKNYISVEVMKFIDDEYTDSVYYKEKELKK